MHLLIDADSALYRAGCANETRYYVVVLEGEVVAKKQYKKDAEAIAYEVDGTIEKIKEAGPVGLSLHNLRECVNSMFALAHDSYEMFIGGEGNFRYDSFPEYKANRDPLDKPIHLEQMKKHLQGRYGAIKVDGEEVDDVVSYKQCMATPNSTCIVTIDKDLDNTAGLHYNWVKGETYYISPEQADLNFARQLLMGDVTDGVPGLPKMGVKGAEKILPSYRPDWLEIVKEEYLKRGCTLEYLNQMGRCLHMRRRPNELWDINYDYTR